MVGDDEGSEGILRGLYGALVVRKPGDPKPAHTFVIVGNDKTLNGRVYPDTPTYTARQGELVEWVIISHGNRVHTFHLHEPFLSEGAVVLMQNPPSGTVTFLFTDIEESTKRWETNPPAMQAAFAHQEVGLVRFGRHGERSDVISSNAFAFGST